MAATHRVAVIDMENDLWIGLKQTALLSVKPKYTSVLYGGGDGIDKDYIQFIRMDAGALGILVMHDGFCQNNKGTVQERHSKENVLDGYFKICGAMPGEEWYDYILEHANDNPFIKFIKCVHMVTSDLTSMCFINVSRNIANEVLLTDKRDTYDIDLNDVAKLLTHCEELKEKPEKPILTLMCMHEPLTQEAADVIRALRIRNRSRWAPRLFRRENVIRYGSVEMADENISMDLSASDLDIVTGPPTTLERFCNWWLKMFACYKPNQD